ncbi:hypothetical protein GQ55_5G424100 [Panicum hallii var. hallii]|uniref:Uncharacterized protein n=1 Tax=Panicum hallii var. hallii TaxID=1504633 RepID=A0A2T7DP36_9POAL|nr:hypothetical protein GQ55_5G424100 [Panicum hallii var. hallii]
MLPAANVTARQRGRRSGGAPRLAAAVLLLELLALCCLARADGAASLAGRAPAAEEKEVASALELQNARAQEVMERGHYTTLSAEAVAGEEDDGQVMPGRVELEVIQDYSTTANPRHNPHP